MTLQVQEIEYCKDQVHFVADPEVVREKRKEAIKELRKQKVKISGFRTARAPDYVIALKKKKEIEVWMKRELNASAFSAWQFETKDKPIGYPMFKLSELNNSEFWCEFQVLKKPKFELNQYKDFEIPNPHQSMTESEVTEKMLQELREKHGNLEAFNEEDIVTFGDKITIDYTCEVDGQLFEGASREGVLYHVGDNLFPEFDQNILGMKTGEERVFEIAFADDSPAPLPGKTGKFTVKLNFGMKSIPHSLDDVLAEKCGFKTFEELHRNIQGVAVHRLEAVKNQLITQQVIKQLLAAHEFQVPAWLIDVEIQHLLAGYGVSIKDITEEQKNIVETQALNNVKLALILDSVKDKEVELNFTHNELINALYQNLTQQGKDAKKELTKAEKDGSLIGMVERLRTDTILQWIVEHSKIIN